MMKQSLGLKPGQNLAMTPRMRQAIRLLRLSSIELRGELQQLLESNYMLEADDDPAFEEWTREYGGGYRRGPDALPRREESLRERLFWQLDNARLSEKDRLIGAVVIDSLDGHGYLDGSMDELLDLLEQMGRRAGPEEVEAVLQRVQRFDPPGVGARNLSECLLRQLEELPAGTAHRELAACIARRHLEMLSEKNGAAVLRRRLRAAREDFEGALTLLRSLNPRPGASVTDAPTEYVTPDLHVFRDRGGWRVELNPGAVPRLRIHPLYSELVRRGGDRAENLSLRQHLSEAKWLIRSLGNRAETLLRVARAIVRQQSQFLDRGEEGMQPLILRDVAAELDLHESTVSRVTTGKFVETPRGVFELRYFFSSRIPTVEGAGASATAIRAHLRKIIEMEEPGRPWSDQRLASDLERAGFRIARRTVAKYRESMGIPPSNERRRPNPPSSVQPPDHHYVSRVFRCN